MKFKNIFLKKSAAVLLGLNIFASPSFAWDPWIQFGNTGVNFGGDSTTVNGDGTITIHNAMFKVNGQFVQTYWDKIDEYTIRYFIYIQNNLIFYADMQNGQILRYGIVPLFVQAQNFVTVDGQQQSPNVTQQQQLSPQISRSAEIRALGSQESSKDILQTESKDSKSIKSPIPKEERAKYKHRKPKWSVTYTDNQIIFNGIENSIANDYMVIISKDGKVVTINVAKNGDANTLYFKIVGTVTDGIPEVSWSLINKDNSKQELRLYNRTCQKYIHFDGEKYSASTDKDNYRFIFCQRCATRCIQQLLGENVKITGIQGGNIVSCPIKFDEDYRVVTQDNRKKPARKKPAEYCQDCNSLKQSELKLKKKALSKLKKVAKK